MPKISHQLGSFDNGTSHATISGNPEFKQSLKIGLFDAGMTHLHRVGLAGLYMTLSCLEQKNLKFEGAKWTLNPRYVKFDFEDGYSFFDWLFNESFKIDSDGLIDFLLLQTTGLGDIEKINYHGCVTNTFLQHGDTNDKGNVIPVSFEFESKKIVNSYKVLKWYYLQGKECKPFSKKKATQTPLEMFFDKERHFKKQIKIKGLHFPGAAERHSGLKEDKKGQKRGTEIEQTPEYVLCLLFSPTAPLYYQLSHKGSDGKLDDKLRNAIVIPHIVDMKDYSKSFQRYLKTPIQRLSANSLGDAALTALIELKSKEKLNELGVNGCTVFSMGIAKWSKNQKTRTKVFAINRLHEKRLTLFDIAWRCFPNKNIFIEKSKKDKTDRLIVATSTCRGFIADNIASGKEWFENFYQLMKTRKSSERVKYERKGLSEMVERATWTYESDKLLVESVHRSLRNRFGAMAEKARTRGEQPQIDRERERIRSSLMRARNLQTLRSELADIFVRGGKNDILQKNWTELLPLFTGPDWQRARDLALLALASYAGKGSENDSEIDDDNIDIEEDEI